MIIQAEEHRRLFCKPYSSNANTPLYKSYIDEYRSYIIFRSLRVDEDIDMIHEWCNMTYSRKFWQMNDSVEQLAETYSQVILNSHAHSFIGLVEKQPVCLIDLYRVSCDELRNHVKANQHDCGLHLLMCPPHQSKKKFSYYALRGFLDFYFSFPEAERIYAEPDQENAKANLLAKNVGFSFLKTINLSYKRAHLYCFEKQDFLALK